MSETSSPPASEIAAAREELTPDAIWLQLESLFADVRRCADEMAFEEGSGRSDPGPSEELDATIARIRALTNPLLLSKDAAHRSSLGDGDDSARLEEDLETSEREAAKNWQLYWDLYFPLTSKAHYSPAQALASLARTHLDRLQSPDQQPVYGPRAAFAIAAKKGAEIMESLQKTRDESDAARTAPGGESNG